VGRNATELERVAGAIRDNGGAAVPFACDLAAGDTARSIVAAALAELGGIDILVNCASQTINRDVFTLTDEEWRTGFEVKFFAAVRLIREAWPALKEKLTKVFKSKSRADWCKIMEGTDICFAPILTMAEAPKHPHMAARNVFVERHGVTQPAPAPRFSRTPSAIREPEVAKIGDVTAAWKR